MTTLDEASARLIADQVANRMLDPLQALTQAVREINTNLTEVDKRVVHLEATHLRPDIQRIEADLKHARADIRVLGDTLSSRIDSEKARFVTEMKAMEESIDRLNNWHQQVTGSVGLVNWFSDKWHLILGLLAAIALWVGATGPK